VAPTYSELAARLRWAAGRACQVYGAQQSPDGTERYDLLLLRVPARVPAARGAQRPARRVLLNGGTHGDEPAGVAAVTRFVEEGRCAAWPDVAFTITPCINPWGYVHARREGPHGIDLNRTFGRHGRRRRTTPEVAQVQRALATERFDLFIDCHEDVDAPGFYVFAPRAPGRAIVAAAGVLGPIHPGPLVDGELPVRDGVVALDAAGERVARAGTRRDRRGQRSSWPLPAGSWAAALPPPDMGQTITVTLETPTQLPFDRRVAMHLAAIDAALRFA
jgi:hypothetical protein